MKCIVGFKGRHNASYVLANFLCESPYLLTNSFDGLKRDIEKLHHDFDDILMFGVDKELKDRVRIEAAAERENRRLISDLDLIDISNRLSAEGIENSLSELPTHYLCNEAYWYMLEKFNRKAVLIHIPTIKYINEVFLKKMRSALV